MNVKYKRARTICWSFDLSEKGGTPTFPKSVFEADYSVLCFHLKRKGFKGQSAPAILLCLDVKEEVLTSLFLC